MEFRAVGNRCAVHLPSLKLELSNQEALSELKRKGFLAISVDLLELAKQCTASSQYRRGARASEAPEIVDCSSFVKWLYGQRGVWLPRRSIQQRALGQPVTLPEMRSGDLVFVSGFINYYETDPSDGVGHVGMITENGTVIHAANSKLGVIESPMEKFIAGGKLRGVRRYIPHEAEVITLETPPQREVETSDDLRWIILQTPRRKP